MGKARAAEPGEERWRVLFDSIHHVLAAERAAGERGVWHDLVPVPRPLSSDCGMALEFRAADLAAVEEVLKAPGLRWRGVYRPAAGGYEPVRTGPAVS